MKKIIIVGNGFDIAHGLETTYKNFADYYEGHHILKEFHELVDKVDRNFPIYTKDGKVKDITWYSFEENIERIAYSVFQKNFIDNLTQEEYDMIENEMIKINELFSRLSKLFFQYIEQIYKQNQYKLKKIKSIENEITNDSYIITFNYTDTVKQYSNNNYYIHGSITDDKYIVLGFAIGDIAHTSTNQYYKYLKDVLKERLNFLRFLKQHKYNDEKELLDAFERHLECLFSGKGGYDFPLLYDDSTKKDVYDTSHSSKAIQEYAKSNNFSLGLINEQYEMEKVYKNIKEIVIMGHGLEADLYHIKSLFEKVTNLKKVKLYTFVGENKNDLNRKIKLLRDYSSLKNIEICQY